jgi:acyl-CoA synthetase (NDP forming)
MAIISGPGGLAVSAAEAVGANGLKMARLTPATGRELAEFVPPTGTSLRNPVDVSLTASLDMDIYVRAARAVAGDPDVDAVVMIGIGLSQEANEKYTRDVIQIGRERSKPFLMVNIPGFDPELGRKFCAAGLPFFDSAEKALGAYAKVVHWQKRREKGGGKG